MVSLSNKLNKRLQFISIFVTAFVLAPTISQDLDGGHCTVRGDEWRFDCLPQGSKTKTECLARGCCWSPPINSASPAKMLGIPICYYPANYTTYTVVSEEERSGRAQLNATLRRPSHYSGDVKELSIDIIRETDSLIRIQMKDAENKRWTPPPVTHSQRRVSFKKNDLERSKLKVKWSGVGMPLGLTVYSENGSTILQTAGAMIFSNQMLQISFLIPSHSIYGLGQHQDRLMLNTSWSQYTLWNSDGHNVVDNINLYGSHPFYLCKASTDWYGFFLYNSNAMDVILQPTPAITWRPIGGILDMYIFIGPSPTDVIAQYYFLIGTPTIPPYWSFGFHLCAQEYGSAQETLDVVERMRKFHIPQDVQWNDIEYAYKNRVFTNDVNTFGNQTLLANALHERGMHYVMMADCGISNGAPAGSYAPYDIGKKMNLFIKDAYGNDLVGRVWPGKTVWPDFLNPESQAMWSELIRDYHERVPFDGLWLDMNEISNFVNGSIQGCAPNSSLDFPPYLPGVNRGQLFTHTLCPSAKHQVSSHYNVHNLYSLFEAMRSYKALIEVRKKRPFLISRSSFPGLGQFAGVWSGDNKASWYDMYKSISAMLHMNMYGIPLTGSDICGFYLNATEELCTRWQQLGAFYSFSRNHHSEGTKAQDPASFSATSIHSSRKALLTRYSLLPYLYTLMWFSHEEGHTVIRPLFFEFHDDVETYNLDTQFLWGSGLMISPVLKKGERHVRVYFPKARWYDFYSGRQIREIGEYTNLPAPLDVINLHIRGGSILVTQQPAQTTTESRKLPFGLIVALDSEGSAQGHHYFDDGVSLTEDQNHLFNLLAYSVHENFLISEWTNLNYTSVPMILSNVTVLGVTFSPSKVTMNHQPVSFIFKDTALILICLVKDGLNLIRLCFILSGCK